jgi:hypothetical protein
MQQFQRLVGGERESGEAGVGRGRSSRRACAFLVVARRLPYAGQFHFDGSELAAVDVPQPAPALCDGSAGTNSYRTARGASGLPAASVSRETASRR